MTLNDYISRIKDGKREIYYLAAPSREVAESSPYYESLKKQNVEVLFCTELHDEHVLVFLQEYKNCRLTSLEKEMSQGKEAEAADFGMKFFEKVNLNKKTNKSIFFFRWPSFRWRNRQFKKII